MKDYLQGLISTGATRMYLDRPYVRDHKTLEELHVVDDAKLGQPTSINHAYEIWYHGGPVGFIGFKSRY